MHRQSYVVHYLASFGFPIACVGHVEFVGLRRRSLSTCRSPPQASYYFWGQNPLYRCHGCLRCDFSFLLGRDYIYAIRALVSSLFHVVYFLHAGRIMTIDQLSFFGPQVPPAQLSSPPGFSPPVVSTPPQVNYVATSPVLVSSDDAIMHSVLGTLGLDFQDVVIPPGVVLLEAMTSCSL